MNKVLKVFHDLSSEYNFASAKFEPFNSAHEGYAIILEELEELKTEVFKKQNKRSVIKMRKEALQVATMAIRFIIDVLEV